MTKARRSFTDEFKRESVALLRPSGRPLIQLACELGIPPSMLRNWQKAVTGGLERRRRAHPRQQLLRVAWPAASRSGDSEPRSLGR
jgi:transposase